MGVVILVLDNNFHKISLICSHQSLVCVCLFCFVTFDTVMCSKLDCINTDWDCNQSVFCVQSLVAGWVPVFFLTIYIFWPVLDIMKGQAKVKKVKVAHTPIPSVGFRSRSGFSAVSLQVT